MEKHTLPPFKFNEEPKHFHFVDSWQFSLKDNNLFFLSLGIRTDLINNKGEILSSFVMEKKAAYGLYEQLNKLFGHPQSPNTPDRF